MAKSKPSKARQAAEGAWGNQYVQRLIHDEELRDNVRVALDNAAQRVRPAEQRQDGLEGRHGRQEVPEGRQERGRGVQGRRHRAA